LYLIGYDIGSSSIKAAIVEVETSRRVGFVQYPDTEMDIISKHPGWAEQDPEIWWEYVCQATRKLLDDTNILSPEIAGIGIAYQMHGLILIDKDLNVLRPSIIWCDSRSVEIGKRAFEEIGPDKCLTHLLNSPGNFTASKLKWVKDHEPDIYNRIHKIMLPGDFIAMKLTGEVNTTVSGLSEAILWDFKENKIADFLLEYFEIGLDLIPDIVPSFGDQGSLTTEASELTGLNKGTPVTYRAGDQPNNALSLNVLNPGEMAATGGTSGVVYGVEEKYVYDQESRVNSFAHVNHSLESPRIGILLCINGAGILYSWVKNQIALEGTSYEDMERMMASVPVNSDGLRILPFGNGAERILLNENPGASINNLHFNRHSRAHFYRAAIEGIAFSFIYGLDILKQMGLHPEIIRVGNDNLFKSEVFSTTVCNLSGYPIEVHDTSGAVGAARGAGFGASAYMTLKEAFSNNEIEIEYQPQGKEVHQQGYQAWKADLDKVFKKT